MKRLRFPVVTKGAFIDIVLGSSIVALCGDDRLNFMADKEEMFYCVKMFGLKTANCRKHCDERIPQVVPFLSLK